jgi:homoserine dehydrogenase
VADLVDVVRVMTTDPENRVPHLAFQPDAITDLPILNIDEVQTAYYLRMQAEDKPGVLAEVTRILGEREISIEAIIQKEPTEGSDKANVIMLTHVVRESKMNEAIEKIEAMSSIHGNVTRIRVESLKA